MSLANRIYAEHTESRVVFAADRDELHQRQVRLKVGNQSFAVGDPIDDAEHADWMRRQLAGALARLVEDLR